MIVIINLFIFLLLIKQGINKTDFDRLPTPTVNFRYFVELDQTYKILGSCTEVKTTTPMSRCILKIVHKYKPKYLSIQFAEELVGTGIVIHKSTDNGAPYVIILTAFHIVVPQLDLNLLTFMLYIFLTICVAIIPIIIYYSSVVNQHLCKLLFGLISYVIICSCLVYYALIVTYPFLFDSFFQITLLSNNKNSIRSKTSQVNCELISSNFVLSYTWWDDIGLIKCSNIQTNTFRYLEECKPVLHNIQSTSDGSMNIIGYVARAPLSFDLIIDPFFSSLSPLMSINTINGKTPSNLLHLQKFMNCTGNLRLKDGRKIFIDTPSTYGFSGGPCFFTLNVDEWSFDGLLTGASRLWNVCTSLKDSKAFLSYYRKLNKNRTLNNLKNDL